MSTDWVLRRATDVPWVENSWCDWCGDCDCMEYPHTDAEQDSESCAGLEVAWRSAELGETWCEACAQAHGIAATAAERTRSNNE